jgi:RHS repeat-associated protein
MNIFKYVCIVLAALLLSSQFSSARAGITYYYTDQLGSPVATADDNGNILWRAKYYPYGDKELTSFSAAGSTDAAQNTRYFTAHVDDVDTGLTYMQARYYDPVVGRFLGVDSMGFIQSDPATFNRYSYVRNNPYRYIDPDGKAAVAIIFFIPEIATGLKVAGSIVGAAVAGYGAAQVYNAYNEADEANNSSSTSTVDDLEIIHSDDTLGDRPDLEGLSDSELLDAVNNPKEGDKLKVNTETGGLVDGNSRARELKNRANDPSSKIQGDTEVEVEPYVPDNTNFPLLF